MWMRSKAKSARAKKVALLCQPIIAAGPEERVEQRERERIWKAGKQDQNQDFHVAVHNPPPPVQESQQGVLPWTDATQDYPLEKHAAVKQNMKVPAVQIRAAGTARAGFELRGCGGSVEKAVTEKRFPEPHGR
eukprot:2768246-Rhodomonas_salina.3